MTFSRGSAIAKIVGENTKLHDDFDPNVQMWVYNEQVDDNGTMRALPDIINERHENIKYLPNIKIPKNIVANPDIQDVSRSADIIIFVIPDQMKGHIKPDAIAISCVKGVKFDKGRVSLYPQICTDILGIYCGALSGANIAREVAEEKFSETTIGWDRNDKDRRLNKDTLVRLFKRPYFNVDVTHDVDGVCLGGALKNVVALGAGLVSGLNWGSNAQSAVMRQGLLEIVRFCDEFFPRSRGVNDILQSCFVADVLTSCISGRNFKTAREFVNSNKSIEKVAEDMLGGQIAQGIDTTREVFQYVESQGAADKFPLFVFIYGAINRLQKAEEINSVLCDTMNSSP